MYTHPKLAAFVATSQLFYRFDSTFPGLVIWSETTCIRTPSSLRSWLPRSCLQTTPMRKRTEQRCWQVTVAVKTDDLSHTELKVVTCFPWFTCGYRRWSCLAQNGKLAVLWYRVQVCSDRNWGEPERDPHYSVTALQDACTCMSGRTYVRKYSPRLGRHG